MPRLLVVELTTVMEGTLVEEVTVEDVAHPIRFYCSMFETYYTSQCISV